MWKQVSSFIRRHRRKFFIIGGVIGGFALLNKYFRTKLLEWEEKRKLEYIEAIKRQTHFEGVLQTCDSTLLVFVSKVSDSVSTTLDVNPVVEALKSKPSNKIELWDKLKVLVFTQAVGEIYAHSLLIVLLRVQISVLGGYMYIDFLKNKSVNSYILGSSDSHQKYLAQVLSFSENGVKELLKPVENSVRAVLQEVNLKELLMLKDIAEILDRIKLHMSQGKPEAIPSVSRYVMLTESKHENQDQNVSYDDFLIEIINETKDILECSDFNKVLLCCIEKGFAILMDRFYECFVHVNSNNNNAKFVNPHSLAVPLAKIIPVMHSVMSQHKPNEQGALAHVLLQEDALKCFAANVYESFSQCTQSV